ncbi:Glutathione S-transferase [Pyrenophora tritici-repentis]|nr:Glutathione S-transferase [Pyrenophora tritici-repentis]
MCTDETPLSNHGQFQGLRLIAHPPDLDEWREKLFHVDDIITLTEDQFQTYFPHIDNVYSHRSTQRHKRKRFVSHYWDCRLKGRPPGTKKSTDPDKKKRRRVARERDLCDVKIKITEFFDRAEYEEQLGLPPPGVEDDSTSPIAPNAPGEVAHIGNPNQNPHFFGQAPLLSQQPAAGWDMPPNMGAQPNLNMSYAPQTGPTPKKFYTFQRVNGNGGNGKGDGVPGPHKHTLEESDRVKKNSVLRWQAKVDKDDRKRALGGDPSKKTYHKKATGNALTTAKVHSKEDELKLYGSAFCPFVQRVWISLEHKQLPYQYIEVDPYKKPPCLLEVNPRGLVPALRHGPSWSTHESTVIMEYLEDLNAGPSLLPPDAQTRATSRLWADHINRNIIPYFYKLLQAQDQTDQVEHAKELRSQISKLVDAAHPTGPFFLGPHISFVDVQIAPWIIRLRRVLGPYRGWPEAEEGSRWKSWIDAIEGDRSVIMTTSTDELYLDSYERYAENRPGTSMLADAVNSGRGLP